MKHLFTLSERLKGRGRGSVTSAISATSASAIFCKLVEMVKLFMPFMKATKRQSDTTFFAESLKSLMSIFAESAESAESAKPIFANRGVKDVRVSLDQYPTNIQRISNLYLTPNRYLTRFAAVIALVFVLGVGNVWGAVQSGWARVTNVSQVKSGGTFVIGYEATANSNIIVPLRSNGAEATTTATGKLYSGDGSGTTSNNGTIDMSNATTTNYEVTIVAGYASDYIAIRMASGNYIGNSGTKNTAKLYTTVSANSSYTPTMGNNNVITLTSPTSVSTTYTTLQYNSNNNQYRYCNYGGTQKNVVMYKKLCTISFDANGGSVSPSSRTQTSADVAITLPTPTRPNYTCTGWFTAKTGGTKRGNAGGSYIPTASETLYAQWEADAPAYTITAARNNASYGNVSLSGTTITATPAACCEYASPAYTVSPAGSATVSQDGNAFTVTPSANTTVTINFRQKSAGKIVNFDAGTGVCATTSLTEDCDGSGVVLPNVTASGVCKGWTTFAGWATSAVSDSTTTSVTLYAEGDTYYPASDNMTLYAVYSKNKSGGSTSTTIAPEDLGVTSQNAIETKTVGTITFKGELGDQGTATNVPKYYSGTPNTIRCYASNDFTISSVSAISQIDFTYNGSYSGGTPTPSVGSWAVTPTDGWNQTWKGSSTSIKFRIGSSQWRITSVKVTTGGGSTTYYCSDPNCCQPLAQVNGSVSLSQLAEGENAGKLKATWPAQSNTDGWATPGIVIKIYEDGNATPVVTSSALANNTTSFTATDFSPKTCTQYYATLTATHGGSSTYCAGDLVSDASEKVTTAGYSVNVTGVTNVTPATAFPSTTCASGFSIASMTGATGYDLPSSITVTGASHTWNNSTGALTISNVTGDVTITITGKKKGCTPMDAVEVATPTVTYNGASLSWSNVDHATKYKVYIKTSTDVIIESDEDISTSSRTYTVSAELEHLTTYKYSIVAVSDDEDTYCSSTKNGTFATADYPTVTLYYSENGVLSEGVDQQILTDFTLPNEAAECSKTFIGWTTQSSYSHASEAPDSFYEKGATFQIPTNANCTLYAVYADVVEASTNWTRVTAVNTLTAGGTFIMGYEATSNSGEIVPMQNSVSSKDFAYSGDGTDASNSNTIDMGNVNFSTAKYEISVVASTVVNGAINIKFGDKFLGNANEKNCAKLYTEEAATTAFTPTIGENDVFTLEIKANTGNTDNYKFLKYNNSSPRFAVYKEGQKDVVFYKKNVTEASVTNYVTICQGKVAKPVISGVAEGTTYEEAKTITITSATNGATIYYTTDGTEPTTSSNAYSAPFEVSTNGDYTIRAIAVKADMVNSDEATAVSFTLDLPFTTIASFIEAAPNTAKKLVFTAESNARVLAYNKNRIYIQDGTGAMFLYNTGSNSEGHGKTWASGKKIVGTLTGTYTTNDNMPRMTVTDFGATDVTNDAIELPTPIAVEELATNFASNVCKLVTISGVSIRSESVDNNKTINMTKNNVTYNIYNAFNVLTSHKLPLGTTSCTVTGILGQSNSGTTLQLMPISADGISTNGAEAVLPVLNVTGSTNSAEPFEVATNKVITFTPNSNFDAVYAINDEEEAAVTGSSNVTITDEENATKVTIRATREYYTTKEVSYYYRANSALIEYDITKGAMSHGSATIQNAQGNAITYAVGGATVTLIANPAEHYHWVSWNVTAGGEPVTVTNNTFEMPNAAVTVSATFEEDDYATVAFAKGNASVTGDAPVSQKVYVGENATMPGKGSMILSSHNFAGWKLGSNAVLNTGDTYTVTAADHEAGTITFEAQWEPYPWASAGKWELVTNVDDLSAGDYVVIACNSQNTIAGDISNNIMASVDGTFSGDKNSITSIGDACVLTLGKSDDNWTFTNVDAELLGATAAKTLAWGSGTTTWSISIADAEGEYKATIQNTTSTYGRFLYNSGQPRFTTYTSETNASMILPQLYKFVGGSYYNIVYAKGTEDVVRNMPEGHVTDENGEAAIKENTPIRVGYTFTGWKDQDENVYTYNDGHVYAFTKNVTLTAQWEEQTDKYTVSYDANGSSDAVPAEAAYFENAEVTVAGAVSKEGYVFMGWECNGRVYTAGSRFYMPAADMPMVAMYAHGATYDNMTKVSNVYSIESHDAPEGSEAVFTNSYTTATQLTKGSSMTLTLSGYTGYTIEGVILSMKSNNNDGAGTLNITIDDDAVATHEDASIWYGSYHNGSYENILVSMNPKTVKYGEDIVITIAASENSLYCQSFTILYDLLPVEVENTTTIEARDLATGTAVTIHDGGTLNVNADKTLDNLTVEAGGEVSGASALTVNNLTINSEAGKSGQVMNENVTVNGDIYLEIKLDKSGTMNPNKYYCISAPFDVAALEWGNGMPMVFNVDYQLFIYDGDKRARTGNGWQRVGGTMEKNSAYFIGFDDENTNNQNIIRLKAANKAIPTATSIELEAHSATYGQNESEIAKNSNWNGLGNPRLNYVNLNKNVSVYEAEEERFDTYVAAEDNGFVVGTAFFVQGTGNLTFENEAHGAYRAPKRESEHYMYCVEIAQENASRYDNRLYVMASETASTSFEEGKDLPTLNSETSKYGALIWTKNYGMRLVIEETPMVNNKASYELGIFAPANGTYRIETPTESDNADLYLTKDGRVIWNLSMNGYEAELTKGQNEGYGLLLVRKAPSVATGVDEPTSDSSLKGRVTKVVIDEHVYILRDGQMYDVTGKAVK